MMCCVYVYTFKGIDFTIKENFCRENKANERENLTKGVRQQHYKRNKRYTFG
jgi:hypothetical protein